MINSFNSVVWQELKVSHGCLVSKTLVEFLQKLIGFRMFLAAGPIVLVNLSCPAEQINSRIDSNLRKQGKVAANQN